MWQCIFKALLRIPSSSKMQENDPLGFYERCFLLCFFHRESFSRFPNKRLSLCYRLGPALGPVTRLSLPPLPVRGSVSLRPVAGTAEDEGLLRPPPEIVDAVETAVVVLPDVAPLVTRRCRRKRDLPVSADRRSRSLVKVRSLCCTYELGRWSWGCPSVRSHGNGLWEGAAGWILSDTGTSRESWFRISRASVQRCARSPPEGVGCRTLETQRV